MRPFHINLSLTIFICLCTVVFCQDPPTGACTLWADPHLVMFPLDDAQADLRMSYYCQQPGRMNVLKNRFIEVTLDVTDRPFWSQDFEIKLLSDRQVICTITSTQRDCNHPFLDIMNIGTGMDIIYLDSDGLSLTVNSQIVDNRPVFDITINQPYSLIKESTGACAVKPTTCRLENVVPIGKRRKRNADRERAVNVCEVYMKEALRTAKTTIGNEGSPMINHARAACVTDVTITKSHEWGKSAIWFVMMDALNKARLGRVQRRETLQKVIPAVRQAGLRALELIPRSNVTIAASPLLL